MKQSLEILRMKKLAGLLTEGEYAKALLREIEETTEDEVPFTAKVKKFIDKAISDSKADGEFEDLIKADWFDNELIDELIDLFPDKDYDRASQKVKNYISQSIGLKEIEGEYAKALLKEEEKRKGIISFGPFKNVKWYLRYDGEIFLIVTESDDFRKIERGLEITSDEFTDKQIDFLNNEVDELAEKMSEYLTSIGIKNEIYDSPIGYGQEIDNLVVAFDKSDLSKLK
jgi:hypothetical protein